MKKLMVVAMLIGCACMHAAEAPKGGTPGKGLMGMLSRLVHGGAGAAARPVEASLGAAAGAGAAARVEMDAERYSSAMTTLPQLPCDRIDGDSRNDAMLAVISTHANRFGIKPSVRGIDYSSLIKGSFKTSGVDVSGISSMHDAVYQVNKALLTARLADAKIPVSTAALEIYKAGGIFR